MRFREILPLVTLLGCASSQVRPETKTENSEKTSSQKDADKIVQSILDGVVGDLNEVQKGCLTIVLAENMGLRYFDLFDGGDAYEIFPRQANQWDEVDYSEYCRVSRYPRNTYIDKDEPHFEHHFDKTKFTKVSLKNEKDGKVTVEIRNDPRTELPSEKMMTRRLTVSKDKLSCRAIEHSTDVVLSPKKEKLRDETSTERGTVSRCLRIVEAVRRGIQNLDAVLHTHAR